MIAFKLFILVITLLYIMGGILLVRHHQKIVLFWLFKLILVLGYLALLYILLFFLLFGVNT